MSIVYLYVFVLDVLFEHGGQALSSRYTHRGYEGEQSG